MRFRQQPMAIKKIAAGLVLGIGLACAGLANEPRTNGLSELQSQLFQAEAYRDSGNYLLAEQQFNAVLAQAGQQHDPLMQAMATGALGYSYYLMRHDDKAQTFLQNALQLAKTLGYPGLNALLGNYLGMLQMAMQQPELAAVTFQNALANADLSHDPILEYGIRLNQAKLGASTENRCQQLLSLSAGILHIADTTLKTNLLLNLGAQMLSLGQANSPGQGQVWLKTNYQVLEAALNLADKLRQLRFKAQAQAYLAKLYQQQHRDQDALLWFGLALFSAQQANANDLLMQFETQQAQVLQQTGNVQAALAAYRRAVKELADIRRALPLYLHDGQSSMQQLIEPAYRGLADILLSQAQKPASADLKQQLRKEAIAAMEASKQAEMEDFFKDRCLLDEKATSINLLLKPMPGVAVVYPLVFADRIELLWRLGADGHIGQASIPVAKPELVANASELAGRLRNGKDYRQASYNLYNWLLRPFQEELKAKQVKTLVYVPDGVLRQVPIAALNDGQHFVLESFASVTLPGLELEEHVPSPGKRNALIAGLSKPDGPSLDQLPREYLDIWAGGQGSSENAGEGNAKRRDNLVAELSLPGISHEVAMLQKKMPNTTLLNQTFTYGEFHKLVNSGAYSIVHIASHGYFGKHAEDSFIMAYDRNVKLSEFQALLNNGKSGQAPIDLLTLNACETADGDDRALLGFSGIAVKTNTVSAIGTLWPINDEAAVKFMSVLYGRLQAGDFKAEAVRQAQLALLNGKKFGHPYYWSPFILVGSWQ